MYGKYSSSSLFCIPKELRTDLWLFKTSDAEKFVRLCVGFQRSELSLKFLYQDADVIPLADKCVVVRSFVCRNYDKVVMKTRKLYDNIRVIKNGLVSDVESTEYLSRRNLRFSISPIDLIYSERVSSSVSSFFIHRLAFASHASMMMSKFWCHENETGYLYFGPYFCMFGLLPLTVLSRTAIVV